MGNANKGEVDPKYLEDSQNLWQAFIKFSKVSIYIIVACLILLAVVLL